MKQRKKKQRLEKALVSCGDSSKKPNIHLCDWHPRRTGRGQKKFFEQIRTRHFSKFHENYKRTPNTRRGKPRHIIIKLLKNHRRKHLKRSQREKRDLLCRGTKTGMAIDFSSEMMQTRRQWSRTGKG